MEIEALYQLSNVFLIVTGVLLVLVLILFFALDIPGVYNRVTGRAQKKEIAKKQKSSLEENVQVQNYAQFKNSEPTDNTEILSVSNTESTEILGQYDSTEVLSTEGVERDRIGETEVLNTNGHIFEIELEMGYSYSNEIIN